MALLWLTIGFAIGFVATTWWLKALLYPFSIGCEAQQMINQRSSHISLVTLILCLCLGSLVILPMLNVVGLSIPEIYGADIENYDWLDQVEFDEEFVNVLIIGTTIADLFFSKSRLMNLDFPTAYLSPVSPPPKYS